MRLRFLPLFIVLLAGSAHAQLNCKKSYGFQANTAGASGAMLCDSSVDGFLDGLKDFNRSNLHYTDTSQANIFGRVNDVNILMDYSAGSNTLNYKFVELGEAGSFTGLTRKESQKMFENYIKKNNIIGRIMEYQAKNSATSPIAGVGGLIPSNIAADFDSAFTNTASAITGPASSGASNNNLVGVGVNYASYSVDNSSDKVKTASIPLSYTIRNGMDPRRQLQFSMPITVIEIGNAKTVHTGLGVAYRLPITDNWTLSPSARYSAVASKDRATVASVYSAALSSTYVFQMSGFDVAIGNMLGYYATGKLSSGDYSFNPDIKYVATRNGIMLSQPVNLGKKMSIEYSLIDTRYLGSDKPYVDNTQEFGITIGTNKSAQDARSFIRGGLSYMRGPGTHGFMANFGYWF